MSKIFIEFKWLYKDNDYKRDLDSLIILHQLRVS